MPNRVLTLFLWITVGLSTAANAQSLSAGGCSPKQFAADTVTEARSFGHGITRVPKAMVRPRNLAWELPVAAATGLLITKADIPLDRRVRSLSFERSAGRISNLAWSLAFVSGAVTYATGCGKHDHYMRDTGF